MSNIKKIEINKILKEYECKCDCFSDEPERIKKVKYVVNNILSPADRIIIILYTELQSYRKLGKLLGVSHTTAGAEVRRIRILILSRL